MHGGLHVCAFYQDTLFGIVRVPSDNPVLPPFVVFQVVNATCHWFPRHVHRIERAELPPITPEIGQALVDHGWWRVGTEIRRRTCPGCAACRELRVDAQAYHPSRAQRRAWTRAQGLLIASWEQPGKTAERWALIQRHAHDRFGEQASRLELRSIHGYGGSVHGVLELRTTTGSLIALAVVEILTTGLLARIAAWDATASTWSPGVLLIQHAIAETRRLGLRWLYLGPVVDDHAAMSYKRRFRPHGILPAPAHA